MFETVGYIMDVTIAGRAYAAAWAITIYMLLANVPALCEVHAPDLAHGLAHFIHDPISSTRVMHACMVDFRL